jgi:uncharacterized membrane protein YsdA (DUF1294 family)
MNEFKFYLELYLVLINLIAFFVVGIDKKRSIEKVHRTPEVVLFLLASLFGTVGVLFGIFFFHHKTQKFYILLGITLILIQQLILIKFLL